MTPPPTPDVLRSRIVKERNRLLYDALPISITATLTLAAILAVIQSAVMPTATTVAWFVGISLISLGRLGVARAYVPVADRPELAPRFERRFAWGAVAGGGAWGAASLFLFPAEIAYQVFLAFVIAGVSAGSIATLSASRRALAGFLVLALSPLAVRLLAAGAREGGTIRVAMGATTVLFLIYLLGTGLRIARMLSANIRLRLTEADREAEARRSKDLLERVSRIARVGGWELDLGTGKQDWSHETYRLYGLDTDVEPDVETALAAFPEPGRGALERAIEQAVEERTPYELDLRFESSNPAVRWVRAQGKPVVSGDEVVALTGTVQDITESQQSSEQLQTNRFALQRLHEITADPELGFDAKISQLLDLGREVFGLEVGMVSRIRGTEYRVDHVSGIGQMPSRGATFDLGETFCSHVMGAGRTVSFHHVRRSRVAGHACYERFGFEAYIGTPIQVANERYGTLNFSSLTSLEEPFDELQIALIGVFAEWIGHELARLRTVDELAESEERTRLILHSVGEGICGLDADGRVTFVNPAAVQILGYDADEMLGQPLHDLVHHSRSDGSPYPAEDCPITRSLEEGHTLTVSDEVLWTRGDMPVPVEYITTPVRKDGELVGVVVSFSDVTERHEYERRLTSTLAMQRAILDAANYAIIATDTAGVIRMFSEGAVRMLGYPREEVVGEATPELFHDPDEVRARARELTEELGRHVPAGFDAFVALARERDQADERKWTYIRKDDSRLPVLLSATAVRDDSGTLLGYLGVAADLTERERVDQLKREFVSTVSHELRTPLTSIRGSLGLVAAGAAGEVSERARELIGVAARNSERLIVLINDILDMEKIESGKMEITLAPQPVWRLVEQALEANAAFAESHGTQLVATGSADRSALVNVDENRFLQVMNNLLSNAAKFSPRGSDVEVDVHQVDGAIRVTVTDHGPGIPKEFHARIYEKFSQADASDRRRKGGTGLGLSISRALVTRMGGRIWFETEMGVGTSFTIEFPEWERAESGVPGGPRRPDGEDAGAEEA